MFIIINFFILDKNFKKIGIINKYFDVSWQYTYNTTGYCTFNVPNDINAKLFEVGNYILKSDDQDIMRIHTKTYTYSFEDGERIEIKGYNLINLLEQRINDKILMYNKVYIADIIKDLLDNNFNTEGLRYLPIKYDLADIMDEELTIDGYQNSYGNVLELILEFCDKYNLRYKMILDDGITLKIVKGKNVSNKIKYDYRLNNINNIYNLISNAEYKNVAFVAGEGEGTERVKQWVNNDIAEGIERFELYVDARDLTQTNESGNKISKSEYEKMLINRALSKLSEHDINDILEIDIDTTKYKPLFDYHVADTISVNVFGDIVEKTVHGINLFFSDGDFKYNIDFGQDII